MEAPAGTPAADRTFAGRLRGAGPLGWLSFLVVAAGSLVTAFLGALLAIVWAALSGTPWRDLGFVRPRHWALTIAAGVVLGVAFKLAMKSVVMPLLGAPPMNQAFQFLAGDKTAFHQLLPEILFAAGFGEEVLFRGYLFDRLGRVIGRGAVATVATVLITSVLFAAAHYLNQGVPGVQQGLVTGLVFGAIYARTRALPLVMIMHASFDLTAAWLIYHRLETTVAHWVFH
jgi:membrane protease YdiL (CAAX protease family)